MRYLDLHKISRLKPGGLLNINIAVNIRSFMVGTSPGQILLALLETFHHYFQLLAFLGLMQFFRDPGLLGHELLVTLFHHGRVNLVRHGRRFRILFPGIFKDAGILKALLSRKL